MNTIEIYQDDEQRWLWRVKSANGRPLFGALSPVKQLATLCQNIEHSLALIQIIQPASRDRREVTTGYRRLKLCWRTAPPIAAPEIS